MPRNKVHDLIEDSYEFDFVEDAQITRVGLTMGAMARVPGIIYMPIDRVERIIQGLEVEVDRDLNKIDGNNFCIQLANEAYDIVLMVTIDRASDEVIAVPFSNNTADGKYAPYDLYLRLETFSKKDFQLAIMAINPLAEGESIPQAAYDHAVSLSAILTAILTAMVVKGYSIEISDEDLSKLNKKRLKRNRPMLMPDAELIIKGV